MVHELGHTGDKQTVTHNNQLQKQRPKKRKKKQWEDRNKCLFLRKKKTRPSDQLELGHGWSNLSPRHTGHVRSVNANPSVLTTSAKLKECPTLHIDKRLSRSADLSVESLHLLFLCQAEMFFQRPSPRKPSQPSHFLTARLHSNFLGDTFWLCLVHRSLTVPSDKTRQQLHGKQVTQVAGNTYKKVPIAFGEETSLRSETALCSAVLAQSGTDAMVPIVPWPVPGHQRSDDPSESTGCLAARKKTRKVLRKETCVHIYALHAKLEIVRFIEKRVTGRTRGLWRISDFALVSIIVLHFDWKEFHRVGSDHQSRRKVKKEKKTSRALCRLPVTCVWRVCRQYKGSEMEERHG